MHKIIAIPKNVIKGNILIYYRIYVQRDAAFKISIPYGTFFIKNIISNKYTPATTKCAIAPYYFFFFKIMTKIISWLNIT